jgi:hypothetical protein
VDRKLLYHQPEHTSFGPDAFHADLDRFPLAAYAGKTGSHMKGV